MKKMAKGFTLVELLVVIGILGVLMAVLVPNITGAQFKTSLQTFSKQGADIVQKGILNGTLDRASKGKPSLWPHNTEADGMSDDADDIAGKQYGTATEYFKVLFDINNQGNSEGWRPYIDQSMLGFLWGQGVPPAQPGTLEQKNVGWTILSGVTEEMDERLPVMASRNTDTSQFPTSGQNDMSQRKDDIKLGSTFPSPFGKRGCVVIKKNGSAVTYMARDARLCDVYENMSFNVPDGIQLKYLEP